MEIRCIIVDDESLAREGLADYVAKTAFLILVGEFKNASMAFDYMKDHPVDLMFLDINMPGQNGLEFLGELRDKPNIIFTTAYREYAAESYELEAVDYLVKPISFERFVKAVNKAYALMNESARANRSDQYFFVKVDGVIVRVLLSDVLYIEGMKDYVRIHRKGKSSLMTLVSLKNMEEQLPTEFIRVHRSFIVNTLRVEAIEGNVLKIDSQEVPVAPQLRGQVLEKIMGGKYLKR
ncbi:LytR/AlgR family response regulator transcription factor [Roseivirga sp.]|uniref:LytR/AlgR family response regulator transcription factor n=1 Tax=Roseivirga sp. TaxID=1964215 RepID=UPI003B52AD5F